MANRCGFYSEAKITFSCVATPHEGWGLIYMLSHPGIRIGLDGSTFVDPFDRKGCIDRMRLVNIVSHLVLPPHDELPDDAFKQLEKHSTGAGIVTEHLPIADFKIPDKHGELLWQGMQPGLVALLQNGGSIAFSCLSGIGRSPCMAARLLFELGCQHSTAVAMVRHAVDGAIETEEQTQWVGSDITQRQTPDE